MSEGSRLSRWSQRKLAAKQAGKHGGALPEPADVAAKVAKTARSDETALPVDGDRHEPRAQGQALRPNGATPEQTEAMLTEADLPPIEGLTAQSDYTVFLKSNVPEALRKAALRKLWVSDPVLANLDGLNDYCEDHHAIDMSMTLDDTSYKIGRGYFGDDEAKTEVEAGAEPALTGETPAMRAEHDDSQDRSEHGADEAAAANSGDDGDGYSDAPSVASSPKGGPADGSEPDKV